MMKVVLKNVDRSNLILNCSKRSKVTFSRDHDSILNTLLLQDVFPRRRKTLSISLSLRRWTQALSFNLNILKIETDILISKRFCSSTWAAEVLLLDNCRLLLKYCLIDWFGLKKSLVVLEHYKVTHS